MFAQKICNYSLINLCKCVMMKFRQLPSSQKGKIDNNGY